MRPLVAALALLFVFTLAACGDDGGSDAGTGTASATATPPASTATSPAPSPTATAPAPTATAPSASGDRTPPAQPPAFRLESTAFAGSEAIPERFSCEGDNVSPPLAWSGAPAGTEEFALVVTDIDAPGGSFIHWVLYAIPGDLGGLTEGVESGSSGSNSRNDVGWTGPCPPPGSGEHRYVFTLYALEGALRFVTTPTAAQVVGAIETIVLGEAELVGIYER